MVYKRAYTRIISFSAYEKESLNKMTHPTKYIELDSTYRNRNLYPQPADFVVDISQSGVKSRVQAQDVVSDAAPVLLWNNSFQENASDIQVAFTLNPGFFPRYRTQDIFELFTTGGNARSIEGFYAGALAESSTVVRRILDYQNSLIYLDINFPSLATSTTGIIVNPTPLATNTASSVIKFYIPNSSFIDNFYVGYYIQNLNNGEYHLITEYDGTTHLATLDSATTTDWSTAAAANTNYAIRKELPTNRGNLLGVSSNGKVLQLALTANSITDSYIGSYVHMLHPFPTAGGGFSTEVPPYNETRRIVRYITSNGRFTAISAGTNTFTLSPTSSIVDDYYVDCFITNITTGETRQIATYNGSTHSGTVTANWGVGAVGNFWSIRTAFLESAFSTDPVVGVTDLYEIEQYTYDNSNPFNYTGSLVSVSEEVCCEIKLLNLIIPNLTLASDRGGRPAFYPYFYVLFEPKGTSGGQQKNILMSNSPAAVSKLFRCPADDTPTPLISTFIKIDGDNTVQTIKFKPTQGFHFAVYNPDGSLFETVEQDTSPPEEPNPNVQISACFSFRRI